jgi:hypothetical protein
MSEKPCQRCGRLIEYDHGLFGADHDDLCIDCLLKDECACPEGLFKIYLPNYGVKIVDREEYEAALKIYGDTIFIVGHLDEDPRRVNRRGKNPTK